MAIDKQVEVIINGKAETLKEGTSLQEIIKQKGVDPERVAVEQNLDIIKRDKWPKIRVNPNDKIEIVQFMVGG